LKGEKRHEETSEGGGPKGTKKRPSAGKKEKKTDRRGKKGLLQGVFILMRDLVRAWGEPRKE